MWIKLRGAYQKKNIHNQKRNIKLNPQAYHKQRARYRRQFCSKRLLQLLFDLWKNSVVRRCSILKILASSHAIKWSKSTIYRLKAEFFASILLTASKGARFLVFKLHPVFPICTASQSRLWISCTGPLFSDSTIRCLDLRKTDDNMQSGFKATPMPTRAKTLLIPSQTPCTYGIEIKSEYVSGGWDWGWNLVCWARNWSLDDILIGNPLFCSVWLTRNSANLL